MQFDVRQLNTFSLGKIILLCAALCIGSSVTCVFAGAVLNGIGLGAIAGSFALAWVGLQILAAEQFARYTRFFLCYPLTLLGVGLLTSLGTIIAFSAELFGAMGEPGSDGEKVLFLFAGVMGGALVLIIAAVSFFLCFVLPAITIPFALHGRKIYRQTDWSAQTTDQT